jgi:hypothetical protein
MLSVSLSSKRACVHDKFSAAFCNYPSVMCADIGLTLTV